MGRPRGGFILTDFIYLTAETVASEMIQLFQTPFTSSEDNEHILEQF